MLINIFDDYQTARNACVAYQRCGNVTKVCAVWNIGYISTTGNIAFGVVGIIQIFQTVLTGQYLVSEFKPLN